MFVLVSVVVAGLAALGLFAVANWTAFTGPTTLSLGVTTVDAPLGLVMLAVTLTLVGVALAFAAAVRTSMLLESRRLNQELQAQRALADKAETSRLAELRADLARESAGIREAITGGREAILGRVDAVEHTLGSALQTTGNSFLASLGEVEDKLDRVMPRRDGAA